MTKRKLADDLAATNAEYEKLKSGRADDESPRENPQRQAPGARGLRRPELDTWTTEELRSAAARLEIENTNGLAREELIDRLLAAERRNDARDSR